jgi:hypothetical protein
VIAKEEKGVVPRFYIRYGTLPTRVADPHHFNADPDVTCHFNTDPDPRQSDSNLRPLV